MTTPTPHTTLLQAKQNLVRHLHPASGPVAAPTLPPEALAALLDSPQVLAAIATTFAEAGANTATNPDPRLVEAAHHFNV